MKITELKQQINGRELELAHSLCGIAVSSKKKEHNQPCPVCGGKDRFWYKESIKLFTCRQCGLCVDLIGLCQVVLELPIPEAIRVIAEAASIESVECAAMQENRIEERSENKEVVGKTEHVYTDTQGNELYRIIRTDYVDDIGKKSKTFKPFWKNEHGVPQFTDRKPYVPYNLHRLGLAKAVFIVEGEKTADCLNRVFETAGVKSVVATTSQGGSGRGYLWDQFVEDYPVLKAKAIRILPDNDDPGKKYATTVSNAFLNAGARDVKEVTVPKLPEKGDFVDWYVSDGTEHGTEKAKGAVYILKSLCNESPLRTIPVPVIVPERKTANDILAEKQNAAQREFAKDYRKGLVTASALTTKILPQAQWLVPGIIPTGYTILQGTPKCGKSWMLLQMAIAIGNGGLFLGKYRCVKSKVLYMALEDPERRIQDRMRKLNMNSDNVLIDASDQVTFENLPFVLEEMSDIKLVIIDTFGKWICKSGYDTNAYNDMYRVCGYLNTIANQKNIGILLCTHTNKGADPNKDMTSRTMGSRAIPGAADTMIEITSNYETMTGTLERNGREVSHDKFDISRDRCWHWTTEFEEVESFDTQESESESWVP